MNNHQYNPHIIWKSFFIASILQIIPYPTKFFYLPKPSWLILLLIYWVTKIPNHINIGSGFIIGLITDILSGPIIGIRPVLLSSITYLLIIKLPTFCNMRFWQQGLIITLFSFNINLIIYITYIILIRKIKFYSEIFFYNILLKSIVDGIIWIGIFLIMHIITTDIKSIRKH